VNIGQIIRAGYVTRWHATPEVPAETVGQHHAATAALCLWLTDSKASAALLSWALLHDTHEIITGDIPGPVKRASPELSAALSALEVVAEEGLGLGIPYRIEPREHGILGLADKLAAILHVRQTRPDLLHTPEWRADIARAQAMAWGISPDVAVKVQGLFRPARLRAVE
jgi:5'-deoxynucleotidase YfbR-like HD superfamily hydrolase